MEKAQAQGRQEEMGRTGSQLGGPEENLALAQHLSSFLAALAQSCHTWGSPELVLLAIESSSPRRGALCDLGKYFSPHLTELLLLFSR